MWPVLQHVDHRYFVILIGAVGLLLRLALWWVVPVDVIYDDHYEPALLLLQTGEWPTPNRCFECFQPPFFYMLSALVAKGAALVNPDLQFVKKALQGLTLFFGVGALPLVWMMLKQLGFRPWIRTSLFTVVCFLPRHIFMSVTHSNDSAVYFFILLTVVLALWCLPKKVQYGSLIAGITAAMALMTKSTAVVLLPFLLLYILTQQELGALKQRLIKAAAMVFLPLMVFGGHLWWKSKHLDNPLQMNIEIFDINIPQRPGAIDYFSFALDSYWEVPLIRQESAASLFATLFLQFWFESEPKISQQWLSNDAFNRDYQTYINYRDAAIQPDWALLPDKVYFYGRCAIIIGGLIGALVVFGFFSFLFEAIRNTSGTQTGWALLALLGTNLAGIISLTAQFPMYSFMKAAFLLCSLPAFLFFTGYGIQSVIRFLPKSSIFLTVGAHTLFSTAYCLDLTFSYWMN